MALVLPAVPLVLLRRPRAVQLAADHTSQLAQPTRCVTTLPVPMAVTTARTVVLAAAIPIPKAVTSHALQANTCAITLA